MAGKGGFSLCESLVLLGETEIKEPWTLLFLLSLKWMMCSFFGGAQYWDRIKDFGLANLFVTQRSQWGEISCSPLYNPGWSLVHNTAETNVRLVYFSQKGWLALVRIKWLMENDRLLLDNMSKYMYLVLDHIWGTIYEELVHWTETPVQFVWFPKCVNHIFSKNK